MCDGNKRQKEDIRNDKIGRNPNTNSFRFLNAIIRRVVEFFFEQTVSSEFLVVENRRKSGGTKQKERKIGET